MSVNGVGQGAPVANRIFRTIWDGGGNATYDFSSYATNETIDLTPGGWSMLSDVQDVNLGNGHMARGEVFNALQYGTDARSLIANARGGSGNDTILGNAADNVINAGAGTNRVDGAGGVNTTDYSTSSTKAFVDIGGGYAYHDGTQADRLINFQNITGTNFGDRMYGTAGDNVFHVGTGQNIIYGESGVDSVDYARSSSVLFVDLAARYALHDGTTDYLGGISNVTGNNAAGNRFYGTAGANIFTLGTGQNIVYGGGGADTADYSHSATAIYADIYAAGSIGYVNHDGTTDYLAGITYITGSDRNDRLYGTRTGGGTLDGGAGNDTIYAYGGGNNVQGGAGDDALVGVGGDSLTGGWARTVSTWKSPAWPPTPSMIFPPRRVIIFRCANCCMAAMWRAMQSASSPAQPVRRC